MALEALIHVWRIICQDPSKWKVILRGDLKAELLCSVPEKTSVLAEKSARKACSLIGATPVVRYNRSTDTNAQIRNDFVEGKPITTDLQVGERIKVADSADFHAGSTGSITAIERYANDICIVRLGKINGYTFYPCWLERIEEKHTNDYFDDLDDLVKVMKADYNGLKSLDNISFSDDNSVNIRVQAILYAAGLHTVHDLISKTSKELHDSPRGWDLGSSGMEAIRSTLMKSGLSLADKPPRLISKEDSEFLEDLENLEMTCPPKAQLPSRLTNEQADNVPDLNEPETPKECVCSMQTLMVSGCKCGAIKKT